MKSVPSVIKKLDTSTLSAIANLNSRVITSLANEALSFYKESFLKRKPLDNERIDYHSWGYSQGIIDTHEFYRNISEHCKNELENRSKLVDTDSENR